MKGKLAAVGVIALTLPLVAFWEGERREAYRDPIGIPTICYGYAGGDVEIGQRATKVECDALLTIEVWEHYEGVMACVHRPVPDHVAAALTSFAYNVGVTKACGSTLLRRINAGEMPAACAELDRWVYAGGRKLAGLVKRRAQERALCEGRT